MDDTDKFIEYTSRIMELEELVAQLRALLTEKLRQEENDRKARGSARSIYSYPVQIDDAGVDGLEAYGQSGWSSADFYEVERRVMAQLAKAARLEKVKKIEADRQKGKGNQAPIYRDEQGKHPRPKK